MGNYLVFLRCEDKLTSVIAGKRQKWKENDSPNIHLWCDVLKYTEHNSSASDKLLNE